MGEGHYLGSYGYHRGASLSPLFEKEVAAQLQEVQLADSFLLLLSSGPFNQGPPANE